MTPRDTLVCVPGLGLDERAWLPTLRDLPGRRAVAVLPGFGRRPSADDDLRPAALAARLLAALPQHPVVLAGHSASCQVVAHAAVQQPHRVRALVLVGPTTDPRAGSWPGIAQRWLRTAVHEPPAQVPVLARAYARTGPGWMLRAMDVARRDDIGATSGGRPARSSWSAAATTASAPRTGRRGCQRGRSPSTAAPTWSR